MSIPPTIDPRGFLAEVNAGDLDRLQGLASEWQADFELLEACGRFSAAVIQPLMGAGDDAPPFDPAGAGPVVEVLSRHPAFAERRNLPFAAAVLGTQSADPADFDGRREGAELLAVGLWAFGLEGRIDKRVVQALLRIAVGGDAFSRLVRDVVLGSPRGLDLDRNALIPPRLIDLRSLERRTCVRALQDAALGLAVGARPGRAWATGIKLLDPPVACPGDKLVIRGAGFGAKRPPGVVVMFPDRSGRCVEAKVTAWSNRAVTVVVPATAAPGCVGFAEAGAPGDVQAAITFAGELERCIGPAAFPIADKIRILGGVASPPPCPACLSGGANRFEGGPPTVGFTANFGHDVVIAPGDHVVLRWNVRGAQSISLTRTSQDGPFTSPPVPVPANDQLDLGPFTTSRPESASYSLTASNGCGSETRQVFVNVMRTPKLSIARIEVVQVIQRADNSVRLVSDKRTVARVFVDSGVRDFDYGLGQGIVPGIVGNVTVYPAGRAYGTPGRPLNAADALAVPGGLRMRANPRHSLTVELPYAELDGQVRLEAQVAVAGHEGDPGGPWKALGSTSVVFNARPRQEVLPFLVADSMWGLPAPDLNDLGTSLQESRKRYPVDEIGFSLNPAIIRATSWSPGASYNLTHNAGWVLLLNDLQTMIFLFPSTPTGGIRAGLVPANSPLRPLTDASGNPIPPYAVNGMAWPRIGGFAPVFVTQIGLPGTFAHEMGHSIGFNHAPCPAPGGAGTGGCDTPPSLIDGRLPGRTDEVGFDVPAGEVIEIGRGELMSYCGDETSCPGATRWPSIAGWDLLFDTLPVS